MRGVWSGLRARAAYGLLCVALLAGTASDDPWTQSRSADSRWLEVSDALTRKRELEIPSVARRISLAEIHFARVVAREREAPGSGGEAAETLARELLGHRLGSDPGPGEGPTCFWGPSATVESGASGLRFEGGRELAWQRISAVEGGAKLLRTRLCMPGGLWSSFDDHMNLLTEFRWRKRLSFLPVAAQDAVVAGLRGSRSVREPPPVLVSQRAVVTSAEHRAILRTMERLAAERPGRSSDGPIRSQSTWTRWRVARVVAVSPSAPGVPGVHTAPEARWFDDDTAWCVDELFEIAFRSRSRIPCLPLADERKAAGEMLLRKSGHCWVDGTSDLLADALGIDR